jgi:hypothetical protein
MWAIGRSKDLLRVPSRTALSIVALVLLVGCGTVSIDVKTDVSSSESFTHEIKIVATELMGSAIQESLDLEKLRSEGWTAELQRDVERVTITLSRRFEGEEARQFLSGETAVEQIKGFAVQVAEREGQLEYRIAWDLEGLSEETLPTEDGSMGVDETVDTTEGTFAELDEQMMAMMANMFIVNWTLVGPGPIVESNADSFEGNTATWSWNLSDMENNTEMFAVSRANKPIAGIFGACSR